MKINIENQKKKIKSKKINRKQGGKRQLYVIKMIKWQKKMTGNKNKMDNMKIR